MNNIELINITKKYHNKKILDNYSFTFNKGKCYMLVGENGSGKSTLLKIILGLISPTSGEIKNPFKRISYVPEKITLPMNVRVIDFLNVLLDIKKTNSNKLNDLLEYFNIKFAINYKLKELSKGMLQKVIIIQALMIDSDVYIFDEVLNGLDPTMQDKFLNYINKLKEINSLIIITSHYSKYYESVIDEVVKMKVTYNR